MTDAPQILLYYHLKKFRLPTFIAECEKQAKKYATENKTHVQYLSRLAELEMIERERKMIERRINAAKFLALKSLNSIDFKAMAALNKTHIALGLGLVACQNCLKVRFITAAALVHELIEASDEKHLLRLQKQLSSQHLLRPLTPRGFRLNGILFCLRQVGR